MDPNGIRLVSTVRHVCAVFGRCDTHMGIDWRVDLSGTISTSCWYLAATRPPARHFTGVSSTTPSLTAWARACFEQGALASLLYLPGIVPVFTLPGDKMFQSTNAYGGAKLHMEAMLQLLRHHGWIRMASAMIGTSAKPPAWATEDLRVVSGTRVDVRILATPLSPKEALLLLLARWRRSSHSHKDSALSTWLQQVNRELGPDGSCSPHRPFDLQDASNQLPFATALESSGGFCLSRIFVTCSRGGMYRWTSSSLWLSMMFKHLTWQLW